MTMADEDPLHPGARSRVQDKSRKRHQLPMASLAWSHTSPCARALPACDHSKAHVLILPFPREQPQRSQKCHVEGQEGTCTVSPGQRLLGAPTGISGVHWIWRETCHPSAPEHQQPLAACVEGRHLAEPCPLCHPPVH